MAGQFGLTTLDIVVKDVLAADRATFFGASVSENIDRRNFDPLEEARAVEHLVHECSSGTKAGEMLGKSKGWVSQRLALLKLSSSMQALLRSGDLSIRDARRLAALPEAEQLTAWEHERVFTAVNAGSALSTESTDPDRDRDRDRPDVHTGPARPVETRPRATTTRIPSGASVDQIATILRARLNQAEIHKLVEILIRTT